jgi:Carboxylesterase family
VIDLGKPLANDSMIDLENSPGKGPVVDLGNPLGKNPVINLGYSKYKGYTHKTGVTTWLGIRYAAPPIGDLRFAPPKDPPKHGGIQKADKVRLFLPK